MRICYRRSGDYEWEDEVYIKSLKCRESILNLSGPMGRILSIPLFLLRAVGDYGTNPVKIMMWIMGLPALFGLGYFVMSEYSWITLTDINPFYMSYTTFFAMGFETTYQSTLTQSIAIFECFLGLFLIAYLLVAIVRKTLR